MERQLKKSQPRKMKAKQVVLASILLVGLTTGSISVYKDFCDFKEKACAGLLQGM